MENRKRIYLVYLLAVVVLIEIGRVLFSSQSESPIYLVAPYYDKVRRSLWGAGNSSSPTKKILLWNGPDRIEVAAFGTGHQVFVDAKCPVTDCVIEPNTSTLWWAAMVDSSVFESFDAVLVNVGIMHASFLPTYRRPPHQRIVFVTQESSQSMLVSPDRYDNVFQWTMSFQRDSDIKLLYGRTVPRLSAGDVKSEIGFHHFNKTKKVAWMVSHCSTHSKREDYVKELQKFIDIDIYGGCEFGKFSCARNGAHWLSEPHCYEELDQQYKFYLSFENSICRDYVTEKFFNILQHDMIPVVYGGANYSAIAPPHSYIDAQNFTGPKELADYLHHLDQNEEEYLKYFEWKTFFEVEAGVDQMARHAFCDLCAKLHDPNEPITTYASMVPSWSIETQCRTV